MTNKKILNAESTSRHGIKFKSKLESMCFDVLFNEGLNPQYEPRKIILIDGFKPLTPFYDKETNSEHNKNVKKIGKPYTRKLVLQDKKVIAITYTPDIYINYKNIDIWIECKGFENDCFYLKKKLFRRYLDNLFLTTGKRSIYFEVYTKNQLMQAIEIFKEYEKGIK